MGPHPRNWLLPMRAFDRAWRGVTDGAAGCPVPDACTDARATRSGGRTGGILSPWPSSRLRDTRQLVHVYSLAATLRLWDHPHYRAPTFGQDVADNVRNVAIPGTGVWWRAGALLGAAIVEGMQLGGALHAGPRPAPAPSKHVHPCASNQKVLLLKNTARPAACSGLPLSVFCASRLTLLAFLFLVYPAASLLAAALEFVLTRGAAPLAASFERALLEPAHWFALWRLNCVVVALHAEVSRASDQYAGGGKCGARRLA